VGVVAGASVGTEVGSGFPPHAARITASKRAVPRSIKLFFIDICNILLSMGIEAGLFSFLMEGTSSEILKFFRDF
jgi:hypothetical protein